MPTPNLPAIGTISDPTNVRVALMQGNQAVNGPPLSAVADAVGVPSGGTTGQVLTKSSDTDYDNAWADAAQGDLSGPASAVDGNFAAFDGTTGKLVKDSGKKASDFQTALGYTPREVLTANRNYYVATTGSDLNDGLSSGTAFATIKHALDVVASLDLSVYSVTINVAAGTYTSGLDLQSAWVGGSSVTLIGDATTPSNVTLNVTGNAIRVRNGKTLTVRGLKIVSTGINFWLTSRSGVVLNNIEFGGGSEGINCSDQSNANLGGGSFTISAGYSSMFDISLLSTASIFGTSWTLTNTPAWSVAFVFMQTGYMLASSAVFTGSATGKRYSLAFNSGINTAGGGASYLPGDVAGTTATGGQYA